MKPLEILTSLPKWAKASPGSLLDSPAWAMPCRLGDATATMRKAEVQPEDTLNIVVLLDGERHLLSVADSPRFIDLHALWATRAEVPEPLLLALVEKDCGDLLQLVENAVRHQLKIEGLSADGPDAQTLFVQVEDVVFGLTRSSMFESSLGQLRFIDFANEAVRGATLPCEVEIAAFALSAADIASIAVGDSLLLPEAGTVPLHELTLGELFDRAVSPAAQESVKPAQLRLESAGKAIAQGSLGQLAGQSAFVVESISH